MWALQSLFRQLAYGDHSSPRHDRGHGTSPTGVAIEIPVVLGSRVGEIAAVPGDAGMTISSSPAASPAAHLCGPEDPYRHVFAEPLALVMPDASTARARSRRRTLACLIATGILLVVLGIQFRGDAASRLSGVPAPRWHWLAACAGATALFYVANGVSLRSASGLRMSLRMVTAVQLAAAATNRIVPAGLGAIAVHLRFLQRRGMTRPAALAAVASVKGAGAVTHLLGLAIVAGTLSDSGIGTAVVSPVRTTVHDLGAGPTTIAVVIVMALVTGTVAHPRVRVVVRPAARVFRSHLSTLAHSPGRAALLVASQAATRLFQILALACTVWAFGASVTLMSVATVYLVGSIVAGAAPTAGGVGALEPALAFGLTAAGGSAATMLAAVLVYRVISFWLPVVPGALALAGLRRSGDL
nr:YbhN family protein [Candidatus Frankia nodulisporulans]